MHRFTRSAVTRHPPTFVVGDHSNSTVPTAPGISLIASGGQFFAQCVLTAPSLQLCARRCVALADPLDHLVSRRQNGEDDFDATCPEAEQIASANPAFVTFNQQCST